MSRISKKIRQRVCQRAGNHCEYCLSQQEFVMGSLQIDHVIPAAAGGSDKEENLCLACELYNQYKWKKTEETDPESGQHVPLFNPRKQRWNDHFNWSASGAEVVGLTAIGRATVNALRLNNDLAVTVRKNWIRAGWHPPKS